MSIWKKLFGGSNESPAVNKVKTTDKPPVIAEDKAAAEKAMEYYKMFYTLVEGNNSGHLEKAVAEVSDLRIINRIINNTYLGLLGDLSNQKHKAIKILFEERGKEVINGITNAQFLRDLNNTLNAEAKREQDHHNLFGNKLNCLYGISK